MLLTFGSTPPKGSVHYDQDHDYSQLHGHRLSLADRLRHWLRLKLRRASVQTFLLRVVLLLSGSWVVWHAILPQHHHFEPHRILTARATQLLARNRTSTTTIPISTPEPQPTINVMNDHPIPKLIRDAHTRYQAKLQRQSKTFSAAVHEYHRRYGRNPPKGFDDWWEFTQKWHVVMVDEFDPLMRDMEPFHVLSGEEFRRRAAQIAAVPSFDLVRIRRGKAQSVKVDKGFKDSEVSARANGFRNMMKKFSKKLPDMDFAVNTKAEGRILIPWDHQVNPKRAPQNSSGGFESLLNGPFKPAWRGSGSVWESWRRTCPPNSTARRLFSSSRNFFPIESRDYTKSLSKASPPEAPPKPDDPEFTFVSETPSKPDYCSDPSARYGQGHFFSDWTTIPVLFPVLSPAKAPGYMDIKIPPHYYYGSTKRYTYGWDPVKKVLNKVDKMEVPWKAKEDKIFWRGATTGGGSTPNGFAATYQRHRFLRMSSESSTRNKTVTFAYPAGTTRYVSTQVPLSTINNEIMDVAFTEARSAGAYPGGEAALRRDHRFGNSVPLGKHWSFKYLLDIDGMSYSGRFLSLLASGSVPLKSTIYEEFFTDWIEPWVHFIPLSSGYQEIYNIYSFFSGPTDVALAKIREQDPQPDDIPLRAEDPRLKEFALAGQNWKRKFGRAVDMEAYVYRLCLEYARLWADDRDAMTMHFKTDV